MKKLKTLLTENFNKLHMLLEQCASKESLELANTEFNKLSQLLNRKTVEVNNFVAKEECYKLLDQCLSKVFPNNSFVEKNMEHIIFDCSKGGKQKVTKDTILAIKEKAKALITGNLPFNLDNEEWLAKFLQQVCYRYQKENDEKRLAAGKKPVGLREISLADIETYMHDSKEFNQKRDLYENHLIKHFSNKIAGSLTEKGETNIIAFRNRFIKLASACGLNEQKIKHGLELNTQWRHTIIDNQYAKYGHPVLAFKTSSFNKDVNTLLQKHPVAFTRLTLMDNLLKQCYTEKQELNYYLNGGQKEIIDRICSRYSKMSENDLAKQRVLLDSKYKYMCYAYAEEVYDCINLLKQKPDTGIEK